MAHIRLGYHPTCQVQAAVFSALLGHWGRSQGRSRSLSFRCDVDCHQNCHRDPSHCRYPHPQRINAVSFDCWMVQQCILPVFVVVVHGLDSCADTTTVESSPAMVERNVLAIFAACSSLTIPWILARSSNSGRWCVIVAPHDVGFVTAANIMYRFMSFS